MAVASPVDIAVNPSDTDQRYVLWGNGRIDAYGGVPPITAGNTWYGEVDQPIGLALHIANWTTGAGYVMDLFGAFQSINGSTVMGTDGVVGGVPYTIPVRRYVDFSMDPGGTNRGVALDHFGQLYPFGGATAPARQGPRWSQAFAKKLSVQWTAGNPVKAVTMDVYGGLHGDYGAPNVIANPGNYWAPHPHARDLVVTDWTGPSGYKLDLQGGVASFGGTPVTWGYPYRPGADVARALAVLDAVDPIRMMEVWSGGQVFEWVSSTPPTVRAGAPLDEVQTVTITGAPTGGTFTLTYSGQTTAAIARNATATTVQAALVALSNIGPSDVSVTGGPGPTTPWTVAFAGALAGTDLAQMTATSSLTGGTTPAVTVATVTTGGPTLPLPTTTTTTRPTLAWTYSDPQNDSQAAWEVYVFTQAFVTANSVTDPSLFAASALVAESGINPNTRGIPSPVDLPNGTYRMFVRAKDSAQQWSAWSNYGWTQNVPLPATPTGLTATANQSTYSTALSVSATTGGSANLVRFEYQDAGSTTWLSVVGADAVTLATTTTATDYGPRRGVARTYRAVAYAIDPAVASTPSSTAAATILAGTQHLLTAVGNPALGGAVNVQNLIEWTRPVVAGVFQGLGAKYPTVVSDGPPKARRGSLDLVALSAAEWTVIESLLEADSVMLHRDPLGNAVYFRVVGDWSQSRVAAMQSIYGSSMPLIEVRPPNVAA